MAFLPSRQASLADGLDSAVSQGAGGSLSSSQEFFSRGGLVTFSDLGSSQESGGREVAAGLFDSSDASGSCQYRVPASQTAESSSSSSTWVLRSDGLGLAGAFAWAFAATAAAAGAEGASSSSSSPPSSIHLEERSAWRWTLGASSSTSSSSSSRCVSRLALLPLAPSSAVLPQRPPWPDSRRFEKSRSKAFGAFFFFLTCPGISRPSLPSSLPPRSGASPRSTRSAASSLARCPSLWSPKL
mmetsp:Transcript_1126/g.2783  ORF Transcript_1126/g.2783 Transcript_1126/m.2783 type:complete len:242 (-) Transcript_1126:462-1187(-)